RNTEPGRDPPLHESDGHRVAAEPEEGGVPERDETAVAGEDVPAQAHGRPYEHQRHDELVVGIADKQRDQQIDRRKGGNSRVVALERGARALHQVRSHTRPNMPCGRKKMMSRNTTKIAVFWS